MNTFEVGSARRIKTRLRNLAHGKKFLIKRGINHAAHQPLCDDGLEMMHATAGASRPTLMLGKHRFATIIFLDGYEMEVTEEWLSELTVPL